MENESLYGLAVSAFSAAPSSEALATINIELTFAEFLSAVNGIAQELASQGIRPGMRVASTLSGEADWITTVALSKLGATSVSVPLETRSLDGLIDFHVSDPVNGSGFAVAGSKAVSFSSGWIKSYAGDSTMLAPELVEQRHRFKSEDIVRIFLTSGTTGERKPVCLSHQAILNKAKKLPTYWSEKDKELCLFPLTAIGGFGAALAALVTKKPYFPTSPMSVSQLAFLIRRGIQAISGSPLQVANVLNLLSANNLAFGALEKIRLAGGPVSTPLVDRIRNLGLKSFTSHYGSTECGGVFIREMLSDQPLNFLGEITAGSEVRLVAESDDVLSLSKKGVLEYKTISMFSGYLMANGEVDPGKTADGFFSPDDRVELVGDKYFFLGREDDLLNMGGVSINALPIETIAKNFPGVEDCVCLVIEDKAGMSWLAMAIVSDPVLEVAALADFLNKESPSNSPKYLSKVNMIPRTDTGKPVRRTLAKLLEKQIFGV